MLVEIDRRYTNNPTGKRDQQPKCLPSDPGCCIPPRNLGKAKTTSKSANEVITDSAAIVGLNPL